MNVGMHRLLYDIPRFSIRFQGQYLFLISSALEHGLVGMYTILVYNVQLLIMLIGDDKLIIFSKEKLDKG